MTSNINFGSIDANYPVAGTNNDSQGFRDNFSYIKAGLEVASFEITQLQQSSAKINSVNDFNGNEISNAKLKKISNSIYKSLVSDNVDVSFNNGLYQIYTVSNDISFYFIDWPSYADVSSKIRVVFKNSDTTALTPKTIRFGTIGTSRLYKDTSFPTVFNLTGSNHYVVDVWSHDGGENIYLQYIGEFA